jgi:hypothetical protein
VFSCVNQVLKPKISARIVNGHVRHFSEVKNLSYIQILAIPVFHNHTYVAISFGGRFSALQFLVRVLFNSLNHSGVAWPTLSLFETGMLTSRLEGILAFKGGVPKISFGRMSRIHSVPELGSPKSGRYLIVNESNI